MKHLILAVLLAASPVAAHEGDHYFPQAAAPEVDAEQYLEDYANHGFITCYGKVDCLMRWDMSNAQRRLVVPGESLGYFRYPYNEAVTTW